jgi:hypothetical protein
MKKEVRGEGRDLMFVGRVGETHLFPDLGTESKEHTSFSSQGQAWGRKEPRYTLHPKCDQSQGAQTARWVSECRELGYREPGGRK